MSQGDRGARFGQMKHGLRSKQEEMIQGVKTSSLVLQVVKMIQGVKTSSKVVKIPICDLCCKDGVFEGRNSIKPVTA